MGFPRNQSSLFGRESPTHSKVQNFFVGNRISGMALLFNDKNKGLLLKVYCTGFLPNCNFGLFEKRLII